jgi:tetratricopeptide (TPR) repeat protein
VEPAVEVDPVEQVQVEPTAESSQPTPELTEVEAPAAEAVAPTDAEPAADEQIVDQQAVQVEPAPVDPSGPPELPEDATFSLLDREVRGELRGLPKNLAEVVGRHLADAVMLMEEDPELALRHARYARARAARVAMIREAVGLTAYRAGEWAEALSELRAARRMSNGPGHVAIMADCERALGRPERALEAAKEGLALDLPLDEAIELRIVAAGARRDLGELDAAVVALQIPELDPKRREPWTARLCYAYADNLAAVGRIEEAIRWFLNAAEADDDGDTDAAERAMELGNPAVLDVPDGLS